MFPGGGKVELLALTETKLKGNGEISWCGVNGIIEDVQEIKKAREGVAILMNNMLHSVVIDFRCVSSRTLWVKFKFSRVKVCLGNRGEFEERERFWNDFDKIVDRVGNLYRLFVLGDLRALVLSLKFQKKMVVVGG